MREATLRAPWLAEEEAIPGSGSSTQASVTPRLDGADGWTPERFAREQVRHLVRQVFFNKAPIQIRQVVFSAVDFQTDVQRICARVGEALAEESTSDVAVVGARDRDAVRRRGEHKARGQVESVPLVSQYG